MNDYKKQFGYELKNKLLNYKSKQQLYRWLHNQYLYFSDNQDPEFKDLLYSLMMMDAGPESELSDVELLHIADTLIQGKIIKI